MFFLLSKLLSFFLSPIWWITLLLLLYIFIKRFKRRGIFLRAAIIILLLFSNPLFFYYVSGWWEGALQNPKEVTKHDGIILLGGFSHYRAAQERAVFNASTDRLIQAVDLYKKDKADWFIFTGGTSRVVVRDKNVGNYLEPYLVAMGIPNDSLLLESKSRNTHENAVETLKLLQATNMDKGNFLLVTSGFHMKRAIACYKKVGIDVTPFATDPMKGKYRPEIWECVTPSSFVLAAWERLFKEWVGYMVYKIKGYI